MELSAREGSSSGGPDVVIGQYYDRETGLHYNGARYYDPDTGRYLSPDPLGLEGGDPTLYAYAANNPLRFADPLGLKFVGLSGGERAVINSLRLNSQIGGMIIEMDNAPDFEIRFKGNAGGMDEYGGGLTIYYPKNDDEGCASGFRPRALIRYNLATATQVMWEDFRLPETLTNLLSHELGHAYYRHAVDTLPGLGSGSDATSDAWGLMFENATRAPGPFRPSHD